MNDIEIMQELKQKINILETENECLRKEILLQPKVTELTKLFDPKGFINKHNEIILIPKTNLYFRLEDVSDTHGLYKKIIAWVSRACVKDAPYHEDWRNQKYNKAIRFTVNKFLGVEFTFIEWDWIYTLLGNNVNPDLLDAFVKSKFNFDILKDYRPNGYDKHVKQMLEWGYKLNE